MQQTGALPESTGQSSQLVPPYISYTTFTTFLDWLREMPAIPSQIDRSLWESKFAGSTGAQLMSALRFLRLLDGDRPLATLEELVGADKPNRKKIIVPLLKQAYGDDLVDKLAVMTPKMVHDRISALGTSNTTHRKAVSFFINAARENEVTVPASIGKQARNRQSKPRSQRQKVAQVNPGTDVHADPIEGPSPRRSYEQSSGLNLHLAVVAMLQDLEKLAPEWTVQQRDRWIKTFKTTLNYAYPVAEENDGEEARVFDFEDDN